MSVTTEQAQGAEALRDLRPFQGPNLHLPRRCIVATVSAAAVAGPGGMVPQAAGRLLHDVLHSNIRFSLLTPPLAQIDAVLLGAAPVPAGEAVAATCVALQYLCGEAVGQWRVRPGAESGSTLLACACEAVDIGAAALRAACDLVTAACRHETTAERTFALPPSLTVFEKLMRERMLDFTSRCVVAEAERRGIPWRRVDDGLTSRLLVQMGEGHRHLLVLGAISQRTSMLGSRVAENKRLTAEMLQRIRLPATRHVTVRSFQEAVRAAGTIGYPLVVKPEVGSNGRGVTIGVAHEDGLRAAFNAAQAVHARVLIERFIPGDDHRMLVIGGRLVATARRMAAHVVGDGTCTVAQLVARTNQDPRRARGVLAPLKAIRLDQGARAVLKAAGLAPESVPRQGRRVALAHTANLSQGASTEDVSDRVHPDNRWMAETVAAMCNLDIVGIDFITPDITRPFSEIHCAINEINIRPGLGPHYDPAGNGPAVAGMLFEAIAATGNPGIIPLVTTLAADEGNATVAAIARALAVAGLHTVTTSGAGIRSGNLQFAGKPQPGSRAAAEAILGNPDAHAGAMATSPAAIADHGLGWDRSDVTLVRAPLAGPDSAAALDVLLAVTARALVIESACLPLLEQCRAPEAGSVIVLCPDQGAAQHQIDLGRRSVLREGNAAVLLPEGSRWPLPQDADATALAAAAVALALGLQPRGEDAR